MEKARGGRMERQLTAIKGMHGKHKPKKPRKQ